MINGIPTYTLAFHCYLSSVSIDVNNIPIYNSPTESSEIYEAILLNQYTTQKNSHITISLRNEWGEPERNDAKCNFQLIENTGKENELFNWEWSEKDRTIGFETFKIDVPFFPKKIIIQNKLSTPKKSDVKAIVKKLKTAIINKNSIAVINLLEKGLSRKYKSLGYPQEKWKQIEIAFWDSFFQDSIEKIEIPEEPEVIAKESYIHLYSDFRNPAIKIKTKDKELSLDLILSNDRETFIYSANYILKEVWKKKQ